jgi:CRISPR-associated protein Cas2
MSGRTTTYLIAYDIADPARLQRVHRFLKRHGMALQYSVFLARLSGPGLQALLAGVEELIEPREDDVRAYALPVQPEWTLLGRRVLPDGIGLVSDRWRMPGAAGEAGEG